MDDAILSFVETESAEQLVDWLTFSERRSFFGTDCKEEILSRFSSDEIRGVMRWFCTPTGEEQ